METVVENLDNNRAKITVTIDAKTVSNQIKNQYKKVASQYNIPGFRRGKAPRPVIDSTLGKDYVRAIVTDEVVNGSYPEAVGKSGIYPVGNPDFEEENMALVEDGQPYTYVFEISTKPTMELSSYDPISIELPSATVTDEQVDEEVNAILEHYYEIVNASANTKVKEDNFVDMKISATDDNGNAIESIDSDSMQYGLGSGLFPPDFDAELLGLKKGDTKQFTIALPTESYAMTNDLAGKTLKINFDIEVLAVQKKKTPELTDEWVKEKIGLGSVAELKEEITRELQDQLDSALPRLKESRILLALDERLEGEIPEALIEDEQNNLLQDFFTQLQRQGLTLDAYIKQIGITPDQFREDIKMQATDVVKQNMALDAYAAHKGYEVTDEDILAEFEKADPKNAERLMQNWEDNGQMYLVRQGILRQKALDDIMETAEIVEIAPESEKKAPKKKASKSKKAEEKTEDAE